MGTKSEKTGRKRYRIETRMFGKPLIVLQIEVVTTGNFRSNYDGGRCDWDDLPDTYLWRDATVEDITDEIN